MAILVQSTQKRFPVFWVVLAIGISGIFYLHYQDMVKPIPDFDSLHKISANGMKCIIIWQKVYKLLRRLLV